MAAGDIVVIGPLVAGDTAAIDTALSGQVVVADKITSHVHKGMVYFTIVKAA